MILPFVGITIISVAKLVYFNETDIFLCNTNFAKCICNKICYNTQTLY